MSPGYLDDLTPPASNDVKPDPAPPPQPTFSPPPDPPAAPPASAPQNPYTQWTPPAPRARNPYLYMQHDNGRYILALIVVVLAVGGLGTYLYLSSRGSPGPAVVTVTTTVSNGGSRPSSTTTVSQGSTSTTTVMPQNNLPISNFQVNLSQITSSPKQLVTMNGSWQGGGPPYSITVSIANTVNSCQQTKRFASISTDRGSFTYKFVPRQNGVNYYCILVKGAGTSGNASTTASVTVT